MIRRPPRSTLFPYTDALPISHRRGRGALGGRARRRAAERGGGRAHAAGGPHAGRRGRRQRRSEEHTSELQSRQYLVCRLLLEKKKNTSRLKEATSKTCS